MAMITKTLILYTIIIITIIFINQNALSSEDVHYSKGELIYQSTMKTPESVDGWRMEGYGKVIFRDGWMHIFSPKEKMHHVYWCPKTFPNSFIAEFETQNMETDAGLCIIFFAAEGENGEDIFDSALPKRNGLFEQYTRGSIISYHISYYANSKKKPNRGYANLRKNNQFVLLQKGQEGIPAQSSKIHKIRLVKDGSRIIMFVDTRKIIDWKDDGTTYGPVYSTGKIGFRQMRWTHFRYRNFSVWEIDSKVKN